MLEKEIVEKNLVTGFQKRFRTQEMSFSHREESTYNDLPDRLAMIAFLLDFLIGDLFMAIKNLAVNSRTVVQPPKSV